MSQTDENAGVFTLNASPSHLLHRAQQFAALQSASALQAAGITLRQFSVLAAVSENEGGSQSNLVDETGIDRSTLADMVARMETAGHIRRAQSKEDGRAKAVFLTAKGKRALAAAAPAVQDADEQLLSTLPRNRRSSFLSILAALTNASDREVLNLEADDDGTKQKIKPEKPKAEKPAKVAKAKSADGKKKKADKPKAKTAAKPKAAKKSGSKKKKK
ncbi:MAG: MarR family winged helix-turn-helix transcriptional regulator [Pseudomonadota bacterium]